MTTAFFDTSVLIAGIIDFGASSAAAQGLMEAVARGRLVRPHTAWHCCLEFYSVTTRLPIEYRLSPEIALLLLTEEILERFEVHQLEARSRAQLFDGAASDRVAGGRIYDAHIAAIARQSGAPTVVTDNRRHFNGLLRHQIRVLTAREMAAELAV